MRSIRGNETHCNVGFTFPRFITIRITAQSELRRVIAAEESQHSLRFNSPRILNLQ